VSLREISIALAKAYDEAILRIRQLGGEIASRLLFHFDVHLQVRNDEAFNLCGYFEAFAVKQFSRLLNVNTPLTPLSRGD
tara:strand:+ start:334 stop:573 length:240 start_codon:yes stop_codon:yes gene_type:complete